MHQKTLPSLLLAAIIYLPFVTTTPDTSPLNSDERREACYQACQAFIDQPGWELRACVAKCQQEPAPASPRR